MNFGFLRLSECDSSSYNYSKPAISARLVLYAVPVKIASLAVNLVASIDSTGDENLPISNFSPLSNFLLLSPSS